MTEQIKEALGVDAADLPDLKALGFAGTHSKTESGAKTGASAAVAETGAQSQEEIDKQVA